MTRSERENALAMGVQVLWGEVGACVKAPSLPES